MELSPWLGNDEDSLGKKARASVDMNNFTRPIMPDEEAAGLPCESRAMANTEENRQMSLEQQLGRDRDGLAEGEGTARRNLPNLFRPSAFAIAALTTACAAGAKRETFPRRYDCDGMAITATHGAVVINGAEASLLLRDKDGDHYTVSATEEGADYVEYVVPRDPLLDATVAKYGVAQSSDRERRPVLGRGVCVAKGGYTDALQRYMSGVSIADVAKLLSLDEDEARKRIGKALSLLRCRYYNGEC
jgi:hypothetical protein